MGLPPDAFSVAAVGSQAFASWGMPEDLMAANARAATGAGTGQTTYCPPRPRRRRDAF